MGFDDPHSFIREHIIKGDKSDGIPNFLSADDCFVKGERQRPISQKNLAKWVDMEPSSFCMNDTQLANYHRNRLLIDFDYVPKEIEQQILDEFNSLNTDGKQVPLEYFQQHQLNDLMQEYFFRSSTPFKK